MRSLLDHQADGIEYTLHSHGIEGSVVGGNVSPRLIQFHIRLGAGVKYNRIAALADELAVALNVAHCRITRDGYFIKIELANPDPKPIELFPLMRRLPGELPPHSSILGLDEAGMPLLLRMDSPEIVHVLVAGVGGSGKTNLTRNMIASLALQNGPQYVRLLLIDPKGKAYRHFEGLPNLVCPVVNDAQDGLHRLRWAIRQLEKREESGVNSPILVIFIDELADLMLAGGQEADHLLGRLTMRGREVGIHVVACTQKPIATVMSVTTRNSFPTRIVGRVRSAEDARVASGVAGSGADKLAGKGDFLLFAKGEIIRVQAAYISTGEMTQTVEHLTGGVAQERPQRQRLYNRESESRYLTQPFRRPDPLDADEPERERVPVRPKTPPIAEPPVDDEFEAVGTEERLARYAEVIKERRREAGGAAEAAALKRARPLPKRAPITDLWDELENEANSDNFEDMEEKAKRTLPMKRNDPATEKFLNSLKTPKSAFKIGS